MSTSNLPEWFPAFQAELNDDITNGTKIDWTRKPGAYVIAYKTYEPTSEENAEDYIYLWECEEYLNLDIFIDHLVDDNAAELIYDTITNDTGITINMPIPDSLIECQSIDDVGHVLAENPTLCENIIKNMHILNPVWSSTYDSDTFIEYAKTKGYDITRVPIRKVHKQIEELFFLTRKQGERFLNTHGDKYQTPDKTNMRVYAEYPYRNDEYTRIIALLASINLEQSTIVIDHDRYQHIIQHG